MGKKWVIFSLFFSFFISGLNAQDKQDLMSMSLEELLNVEITVASKKGMTLRESPGIISVINREEIINSGAQDLIDVLKLVPGLFFGTDVQGVVGIGVRGNWGHEGKVLLIIDGMEMNETLYSTLQFGNHYPVEHIKKIEIIRGPGSPLYGGFAELAVINITTLKPKDINGIEGSVNYAQGKDKFAKRNFSLSFGKIFNDLEVSAHMLHGEGTRSSQTYTDFFDYSYEMEDNSELNPMFGNIGIKYKDFNFRITADNYTLTQKDAFDEATEETVEIGFKSYFIAADYDWKINDELTLNPQINFKRQLSWFNDELDPEDMNYLDVTSDRLKGGLTLSYDLNKNINLLAGAEIMIDKAFVPDDADSASLFGADYNKEISYNNTAFLIQGLFNTEYANIIAGARYDNHEEYGSSFVPRLALTKVMDRFHVKALASAAFRAPSIYNITLNEEARALHGINMAKMEPEKTTVFEIEAGYKFSSKLFFTANVFDIKIEDPIVYVWDDEYEIEYYENMDKTGTQGFELECKYSDDWGYLNFNYSYYKVNENKVEDYSVLGNEDMLLGFPAHKAVLNTCIKITESFNVNPSIIYLGERYGYYTVDVEEVEQLKKYDSQIFADINLIYRNLFTEGLDVSAGVSDLTDEDEIFIQPYNGWHAPIPGKTLEYRFRIAYNLGI